MRYFKSTLLVLAIICTYACHDDVKPKTSNKIFEFTVPSNYIVSNTNTHRDYWISLFDKNGKILDTKQLSNTETYTFTAPYDFTDDVISISIFQFAYYNNDYYASTVRSYINIPFAKYRFPNPVVTSVTNYGTASVTISDQNSASYLSKMEIFTPPNTGASVREESTGIIIDFGLIKNEHNKGLITDDNHDDITRYLYLDFASGDSIISTTSDFIPMEQKEVTVADEGDNGGYTVIGYTGDEYLFFDSKTFDFTASNTFKIKYPPIFDSYSTVIYVKSGNVEAGYVLRSEVIPSTLKTINGSIVSASLKDNTLSYSANGQYDYVVAAGSKNESNINFYWVLYLGDELSGTIKIPDVPAEIKMKYSWAQSISEIGNGNIQIVDVDVYDDYLDVMTNLLQSETTSKYKEYAYRSIDLAPIGARLNTYNHILNESHLEFASKNEHPFFSPFSETDNP
jgi:hypothetical protein